MRHLALWVCMTIAPPVLAWSDHASLVWPLLRTQTDWVEGKVAAESLDQFLVAESEGIRSTLNRLETWSIAQIPHYPPTPGSLRVPSLGPISVAEFLAAIRVNPTLPYRLYVHELPESGPRQAAPLSWRELSFLGGGTSQWQVRYWPLAEGEAVTIAEVVASASDEPDFGMDIGLFEDNGTDFGSRYGFGAQPFGNPNLDYGSQAPFHMGFYHLDWLTRTVQPDLLRTYPLWRMALFGDLAQLAFETGHPYWGWRFLGWGLHYVGDLTQPYHAVPLPGVDTLDALWLVAQGKTAEAIQLVSNRHGVIESYQYQQLMSALSRKDWSAPLLRAISDHADTTRQDYPALLLELTAQSVAAASDFDAAIAEHVPAQFVADPGFEWTGSGFETRIVELVREEGGEAAVARLDAEVIEQLTRFSRMAARWLARGQLAEHGALEGAE